MTGIGLTVLSPTSGDYFINRGKGVVHVDQKFDTKFIKVEYTSGYDGVKDAPEWLKEAITSYVPALMNQQQIYNRADEQKAVFDTNKEHAFTLLSPYLRDVGFTFRPMGV
jgi:hypothetical protein